MTAEIVERVLRSSRYRDVEPDLLRRLAAEELPRARNADDAVKRVKRRLHQAVGAFRGPGGANPLAPVRAAWHGDLRDDAFRDACRGVLRTHASTRERVDELDAFYPNIWRVTGVPRRLVDLGCGMNPLSLPWMGLETDASYGMVDADRRPLATSVAFLELVGQAHRAHTLDLVTDAPREPADVVLLMKLVPTLDRQDPSAADRLLSSLRASCAVVSFPRRSLGGRGKNLELTYRDRLDRLVGGSSRVTDIAEVPSMNELVFVVGLRG